MEKEKNIEQELLKCGHTVSQSNLCDRDQCLSDVEKEQLKALEESNKGFSDE